MIWLHVGVDARIDPYMQKLYTKSKKGGAHLCGSPAVYNL